MPWNDLIPTLANDQTLTRARSALGRKTVYKLGGGGMNPLKPLDRLCDCSGFVAWAIGIPRQLPPGTGPWLDTDAYARGSVKGIPSFTTAVAAGDIRPGDLWVYPDHAGKQGHIAFISRVDGGGAPTHVIHCSGSNSKAGDAVQETSPKAFKGNPAARVVRINYAALKAKFAPGHATAPSAFVAKPGAAPLKHPMLADPVLQSIAAGTGEFLQATSGRMPGAGAVQDALNRLAAGDPALRVDLGAGDRLRGFFGPKTEAAVVRFQSTHGLEADGRVGRHTLRALDSALASVEKNGVDRTRTQPKVAVAAPGTDFRRAFFELMAPAARASASATGVPASVTLAQGALESNWGRSALSVQANNFFGIKGKGPAGSVSMPTREWIGGKMVTVKAAFRKYASLEESCADHARLIATARWKSGIPIYSEAMAHKDDPRKFAAALEGVYATDPDYAEKLWRLMDEHHLHQYDLQPA